MASFHKLVQRLGDKDAKRKICSYFAAGDYVLVFGPTTSSEHNCMDAKGKGGGCC